LAILFIEFPKPEAYWGGRSSEICEELILPSMTPHNLWTAKRGRPKSNHGQMMADKIFSQWVLSMIRA